MAVIEEKAAALLERCEVLSLASINEDGFPRICVMSKAGSEGIRRVFFATGTSSHKTAHFMKNPKAGISYGDEKDSVTMTGTIKIVEDDGFKKSLWKDWYTAHFPGGPEDPEYCVLQFDALEATIYVDGDFVTWRASDSRCLCRYCQSCGMPLNSEELYGTEADGSKNGDYCRYCMTDGRFTADVTLEEMIELCLPHMSAAHPEITAGSAREMMRRLLPGLKRWRSERD